ncbi:MAG: magnesium transporter, partial [Candidatus Aminicenantes bacterium]|nr:magnesium transporter [Candidatus Aminicenantes bacterium]
MSRELTAISVKPDTSGHFLFISEILNRPVLASSGASAGKLSDLKVRLGEPYPKIVSLTVSRRWKKEIFEIDWTRVERLESGSLRLEAGAEDEQRPLAVEADEVLLREELLDKQVVDTFGARIERVNDIHLLAVNRELRVVHVDFGWRGILRRLGWLRAVDRLNQWLFDYRSEEKIISWKYVQPLLSDADKKNLKLNVSARWLRTLHPSDLADILEELDRSSRTSLFRSLDIQTAAQTLEEVEDPRLQVSLIQSGSVDLASDILEEMAPDEATDLLAELPEDQKDQIVRKMEKPSAAAVTALLKFKEGTAGSIMTKDFFTVSEDTTIGQAIEEFRRTTYPLESVAYVYVTAGDGRLRGVATLRHLIIGDLAAPIGSFMNERLVTVGPMDDVEDVADIFRK